MNEHLRRVLRKANARVKLLSRVRDSLSVFAAKAVYNSFILPTMLYCSTPVVKVSDTMLKKFESVQNRAQKVIYGLQEDNRCGLISINNKKRGKLRYRCSNVVNELVYQPLESMQIILTINTKREAIIHC